MNMKKTPCEWWVSSHFGAVLKQLPPKEKPVPGRRLDEPISKASSNSVIQSPGAFSVNKYLLSPYSVTHIKCCTPLVHHFRSSQTCLLCQPQLWPPVLCRLHLTLCRGSLAGLCCRPAPQAFASYFCFSEAVSLDAQENALVTHACVTWSGRGVKVW